MSLQQWRERYRSLLVAANSAREIARDEARHLCAEAGLDPTLLGIHPHNAMVALHYGQPWPGIDYGKVRRCMFMLRVQFMPDTVVRAWDRTYRSKYGV